MTFSISSKIQDGSQKSEKSKFFRYPKGVVLSSLGVQNLPEITLSLTISAKIQDGSLGLEKSKFFRGFYKSSP